jgi:hypothetical protein
VNVLIVGASRADRLRAASAWEHTPEAADGTEGSTDQTLTVTSSPAISPLSSVSSVVELLRQATVCRDQGDIVGGRQALDQALQLAPDCEAVDYESGGVRRHGTRP